MGKFKVTIKEIYVSRIEVVATDKNEAKERAQEMFASLNDKDKEIYCERSYLGFEVIPGD